MATVNTLWVGPCTPPGADVAWQQNPRGSYKNWPFSKRHTANLEAGITPFLEEKSEHVRR